MVLMNYADHNFDEEVSLTNKRDIFDALALTINITGEELKHNHELILQRDKELVDKSVDLEVANEGLKASLNKQLFLKQELHHRVKNNLQFIIENSDLLSSLSKTELLLTIKVNNYIENKNSIRISLTSEIYNSNTKTFISSWSTPIKVINFSDECDLICKNLLVSETAILLSNQLGESIIRILNAQSKDIKNYQNISKVYNFKLLNFNQNDIIYLTDIMINEFPGFIKISNEESFGKQSTWNYYSSSEMVKLKKWLVISLNEINLNLNKDYELIISENNFFINKFPRFNTYGTKGNPEKFN